jgi:hypothetical protein
MHQSSVRTLDHRDTKITKEIVKIEAGARMKTRSSGGNIISSTERTRAIS